MILTVSRESQKIVQFNNEIDVHLEQLMVILRDGRTLIAFLRSLDQFGRYQEIESRSMSSDRISFSNEILTNGLNMYLIEIIENLLNIYIEKSNDSSYDYFSFSFQRKSCSSPSI